MSRPFSWALFVSGWFHRRLGGWMTAAIASVREHADDPCIEADLGLVQTQLRLQPGHVVAVLKCIAAPPPPGRH